MAPVYITAAALRSPIGNSLDEVFAALEEGRSGTDWIRNFDTQGFPAPIGGEVKIDGCVQQLPSATDRKCIFLEECLQELRQLPEFSASPPQRRALYVGMGLDYFDLQGYVAERRPAEPDSWLRYSRNTQEFAADLARRCSCEDGVVVNLSACVAASQALGLASRVLTQASVKRTIASGGADSMLNPLHFMGFSKLGALSDWRGDPSGACRPFDLLRQGLVLGEGAGLFLLQNFLPDGAAPLGRISGYAATLDAYTVTDPEPEGCSLAAAAQQAIAAAGLKPQD